MKEKINLSIVIVLSYISLMACTPKVIITPNELPDAKLGQPYYARISIEGGSGPISISSFRRSINPYGSGLEITFPNIEGDISYHNLAIQGIPTISENIFITIEGAMIPTILFGGSSEFKKTYIIKVKQQ